MKMFYILIVLMVFISCNDKNVVESNEYEYVLIKYKEYEVIGDRIIWYCGFFDFDTNAVISSEKCGGGIDGVEIRIRSGENFHFLKKLYYCKTINKHYIEVTVL